MFHWDYQPQRIHFKSVNIFTKSLLLLLFGNYRTEVLHSWDSSLCDPQPIIGIAILVVESLQTTGSPLNHIEQKLYKWRKACTMKPMDYH